MSLASDFTRFTDLHLRHAVNGNRPDTILSVLAADAQNLAQTARKIVTALDKQPIYRGAVILTLQMRVRQLDYLSAAAAEHLRDAEAILAHTRAGLPVELGDDFLSVLGEQEAQQAIQRCFTHAGHLTALGAADIVTTAERLVNEYGRHGYAPEQQPTALTIIQRSALHSIARREITLSGGRIFHSREDTRITTVRALESRGLITREDCHLPGAEERVHLSPAGRRDLVAGLVTSPPALPTRISSRSEAASVAHRTSWGSRRTR